MQPLIRKTVISMGRNKWNYNQEGYADITAGAAMRNIAREERKMIMAKKRSCRRTTDENIIHEKAVKMRKMTDEQLVHYVEDRVEKARSEGFNQGKNMEKAAPKADVNSIIEEISNVKGIGTTKLQDIKTILEERLAVM